MQQVIGETIKEMTEEEIEAFIESHDSHIAQLCKGPKEDNPDLKFPFFMNKQTKEFSNKSIEKEFWKWISSIPGKQRHVRFHMAFFGRLPPRWEKCLLKIIQSILVTRTALDVING